MSSKTNLISKFDNNIQLIITKFNEIIELSDIGDKELITQSIEALQIESNSNIIIKLCQELLNLTKTLKENWILGQKIGNDELMKDVLQNENYEIYSKVNKLLGDITEV